MKKLIIVLLLMLSVMPIMMSCGKTNNKEGDTKMTAIILEIEKNYITVKAEDENAFGEYQVNINNSITKYYDKENNEIAKKSLKEGDKVEITYNGQVTRSLPPQIFGQIIKLK